MVAGATHIDHVEMLRAGRTGAVAGVHAGGAVHGGVVLADLHVRSCPPARSGGVARLGAGVGAGSGSRRTAAGGRCGLHDLRGPRQAKARRRVRLHQSAGLSPAAGRTRRHRRGARRPHAQRLRGVLARCAALRRRARRQPAARRRFGAAHGARRLGILVLETDRPSRRTRRQVVDHRHARIPLCALRSKRSPILRRADIDYTDGSRAQVAETAYVTGGGTTKRRKRTVRLVVRRTRLAQGAQQRLWPHWRHHAFITNTDHDTAAADEFQPAATPSSSSPSATSKKAPGSNTSPQATTARTAHGSPAPPSPTTSPLDRAPRRHAGGHQPLPAAPDSSPSPP